MPSLEVPPDLTQLTQDTRYNVPGGVASAAAMQANAQAVKPEASRVAANGGQLFREKFAIGEYGHIALAIDTEGNMFGLHSMQ